MEEIFASAETRMQKSVESFSKELATLRAGRAVPTLLDKITVDYYNTATPLNQLATITAPEPRLLVIQPWDKTSLKEIEKAIMKSDLGLTPNSDGSVIRLTIPQLTEERRKELVKMVRKKAEETRVAIRNIRRDANDQLKSQEKSGSLSEDELHIAQQEVQDLTARQTDQVDKMLEAKEKEIMEV